MPLSNAPCKISTLPAWPISVARAGPMKGSKALRAASTVGSCAPPRAQATQLTMVRTVCCRTSAGIDADGVVTTNSASSRVIRMLCLLRLYVGRFDDFGPFGNLALDQVAKLAGRLAASHSAKRCQPFLHIGTAQHGGRSEAPPS